MVYASFWHRVGAYCIDMLCWLSVGVVTAWISSEWRLFKVWYYVPSLLVGLWFYVYLVKRYGGTPGKLLLNMKIVRTDGAAVDYQAAFLRYLVIFLLSSASSMAVLLGLLAISEAEYFSLSWVERAQRQAELAPGWYGWVMVAMQIWFWGAVAVMLMNKKRRTLHDFVAGTVVIKSLPAQRSEEREESVENGALGGG